MRKKQIEIRWIVVCERYSDAGGWVRDEFCILYGTEAEAAQMMTHLNSGGDPSYFTPGETDGCLHVEQIEL